MTGRRTNLGLLVALVVATGTGVGAFAVGTPSGRAVVVAHGVAGLAVVVLAPWKQRIVRRGLRRGRRDAWAGLALLGAVALALVSGVAHAAGVGAVAGVTAMQVHVGAAVLAVVPLLVHVLARPARPRGADLGRRSLVRVGAVGAVAGGVWAVAEGAYALTGAPDRRFTGSHERGTDDPAAMPVTQWFTDTVPALDPGGWTLVADAGGGAVRHWTLPQLRALEPLEQRAVLDCTGGWWAAQTWRGVAVRDLVPDARGRRIVVTSTTGYARALPIELLDGLLLALDVAGAPLSAGHGAPARLVVPGRRGFWWVKWVTAVTVDGQAPWAQPPFPLR
jgi:hypothetical protein